MAKNLSREKLMASAKVKYVKGWFVPHTAKEREILKKAKKIYAEWIALERKSKFGKLPKQKASKYFASLQKAITLGIES